MVTLLFGAGASYGSGRCIPEAPPLGDYLFSKLEGLKGEFSKLKPEHKETFYNEGFESGMAKVDNTNHSINPLQKELACYLSSFKVVSENAYVRLFKKLGSRILKVNLATLNYDLLIEQSLIHNQVQFDYNAQGKGIPFIKLHGSSNFLPIIPASWSFKGCSIVDCGAFFEGLETEAVMSNDMIKSWCKDPHNEIVSPVQAMYEKNKRVVVNPKLIENAQSIFRNFIKDSSRLIIIGTKYVEHDLHIWKPIIESQIPLTIVDPYPEKYFEFLPNEIKSIEKGFSDAVWDIFKEVNSEIL